MPPGPPHNLPTLVQQKYDAAKASSSLTFSHTDLTTIPVANIPVRAVITPTPRTPSLTSPPNLNPRGGGPQFQLRHCPALSQKPISSKQPAEANGAESRSNPPPTTTKPDPDPDPFASPPAALLIAQLPPHPSEPTHVLVLNKYPVIASHFILATKPFKRQTDLLELEDLSVTFACLRAWECGSGGQHPGNGAGAGATEGKRLFAFFNSGRHSGASQAHRHVQFLPVEEMGGGVDEGGWRPLVDWMEDGDNLSPHSLPQLPFVHFALPIPPDPSPEQLYDRYRRLYEMAVESCRRYAEKHPKEDILVGEGDRDGCAAVISYNLALTTSRMVICPRRSEGAMLKAGERHGSRSLGPVAINGTILGGTLMVKTEEEWNAMRRDEASLYRLLQAVGIPIEHSPGDANGRL